ncbi:cytochrome d ubiquinol oxidase subunit II [Phyllobacterium endophyticum]|uniref:Cytochrome d ubiquinol oxidase subunit II n=1 Tax=Phyllobacterium endophyticum TaxID=1149773 RepID=A0A2P7ANW5_9HYPH|nr:cytochrome d ubiquinol oxidase subunit II [Phyllobacterium endophyticum]MBB3233765.1 cytochrome d ubiquinol oxidase subunit II [Phyllobacterium endophyticum]PSH55894.1 cytochrome d ubiquinol oxidase subunit II [Phyllobacterium endophyticum]TYR41035.1 cytochrome d ubiquinol oxidase subunit II [Phyllobacterium endophyticum]
MSIDLPIIWAAIIAFAVLAYVVLDGFDLGVGILFPLFPHRHDRDVMTNSIAPVWDGNETWLVLGGGGLMAVFPLAYATVLPALYMPIILMLLGLIFRGVAFEFRWRSGPDSRLWDGGFWLGSSVAAMMQGIALGALVQGIKIENRSYAGGWWDWLTPFSILTGVAVVVGYALLGATWLNLKTTGELQHRARRMAMALGVALLVLIAVVSLWTPFINHLYFERWFGWPTAFFSAFVPLLVAMCAVALWHGLTQDKHLQPFLAALGLFVLSYAGLGISFYPYIVPGALTIEEAAAPDSSLIFLLVGAVVLIPIILAYTGYAYWVFRGKIDPEEGYH